MQTIITFYCESSGDSSVGVVNGRLTTEQRKQIAERLALQPDDSVGFAECEHLLPHEINEAALKEWCAGSFTRCGRDLIKGGQHPATGG
jgi:hypothetical protein